MMKKKRDAQPKVVRTRKAHRASFLIFAGLLAAAALFGCEKKEATDTPSPIQTLAGRGRTVYSTRCTACHNSDPKKPGAIGPDVYGSSRELLEARVLHAAYPPGYTPKRATHAMVALPDLKDEIPALHAYLNQ